jgi:hemin uptake protein HemP
MNNKHSGIGDGMAMASVQVEQMNRTPSPRRMTTTRELLGGGNEVQIEHNGEIYTLRQTSKGKLILTK